MHQFLKMNIAVRLAAASFCLCLCAVACGRRKVAQTHHYQVKGKIVSVDKAQKQVVVDSETIPGFMDAMIMPYSVKDEHLLDGLAPGDQIIAGLAVTDDGGWLDSMQVVSREGEKAAQAAPKEHLPEKGEKVPDFALVNQDGKKIRLAQFRGKAVLLTLIYTRCPYPDYCPLMTRHFAAVEKSLAADPKLFSKTQLFSISFDPEHDTPEVLRAYAKKNVPQAEQRDEATPGHRRHWDFAAPPEKDVKGFAQFFGLDYSEENGQIVHSLSTAVISPDGKIYEWYHDNTWSPEDAVKALKDSLSSPPANPAG